MQGGPPANQLNYVTALRSLLFMFRFSTGRIGLNVRQKISACLSDKTINFENLSPHQHEAYFRDFYVAPCQRQTDWHAKQ